jgi:hypothetical protein
MNHIEHVRIELKGMLHSQFSDINALPGDLERVQEALGDRLQVVWAELRAEVFEKLILSIPARVQALYEAKGW